MKKAVIVVVAVAIVIFGIKLLFNNGPAVDPKAEVAAYLTRQLDGLECDFSDLDLDVQKTDEEDLMVVLVDGAISCKGTLVVKETADGFAVEPVVTEAVVKECPEEPGEIKKAVPAEPETETTEEAPALLPEEPEPDSH